MLVFNCSQALIRINNKRMIFEARSPIEKPRMPRSGQGQQNSVLMQFTWNRSIYNSISILLTMINWPPLLISIIGACCWYEKRIILIEFCADLFICDSRKYWTFCEGYSIKKIVGRFMYKMRICTKYYLFRKNIMKNNI